MSGQGSDSITTPGDYPLGSSTQSKLGVKKPRNRFSAASSRSALKIDNIYVLEGHANYTDWVDQMTIIFSAMRCEQLVVDGATPADDADEEEMEDYQQCRSQALLILIRGISQPILRTVAKKRDPHEIWKYLKETYHRDTAFSFVQQITNLTSLPSVLDPSKPIKEFLDLFEAEWQKLADFARSSTTDTYRAIFAKFLAEDKAKRDFLLAFIVNHHQNVVDNLTTKDDLSYSCRDYDPIASDDS
jgi:hypothetical protein